MYYDDPQYIHFKDYEPSEIFDVMNKIYFNISTKMSSFFILVTIVILTWWIVRWFFKLLASFAWLITIVFVTMVYVVRDETRNFNNKKFTVYFTGTS